MGCHCAKKIHFGSIAETNCQKCLKGCTSCVCWHNYLATELRGSAAVYSGTLILQTFAASCSFLRVATYFVLWTYGGDLLWYQQGYLHKAILFKLGYIKFCCSENKLVLVSFT